ncbi:MAG: hypothetical protein JXR25_08095 [Pontiellaceae bacterium]|nr:hypothetical protein [Pontiellaceae bacterium]MBN2784773.1 hypothetical protein [Pontiellaceae bacterium]
MAFALDSVVPWGRSYEEYIDMFALSTADLEGRILGCGDGPASFNTQLTRRGGSVVSVDPLYACSTDQIRARIDETFTKVIDQVSLNRGDFVWNRITDIEELGRIRMNAMQDFLEDFATGLKEQRYLPQALPELELPDQSFDLGLSSHFLFLYSRQLDLEFHLRAIKELCRITKEVRIFPLLQLDATPSPYIAPVSRHLINAGYDVHEIEVEYEFQRGGNRMLKIRRRD